MNQLAAIGRWPRLLTQLTGRGDRITPKPTGFGFRDVQHTPIWRQANPIGRQQMLCRAANRATVASGIVEVTQHNAVIKFLAKVGKPETTLIVKNDIVRAMQRNALAVGVKRLNRAGDKVDSLNRTAVIIGCSAGRSAVAIVSTPTESTIVADITVPIRPESRPIWPPTHLRHGL